MAKRFIDTDIFKKGFMKGLQAPYKLLWIYIVSDCNHAGIYEVEIDVAAIRIGCPDITEEKAIEHFGNKIKLLDNGTKWFIPSFIDFQYGQLSETNRAHSGAIILLKKYGLLDETLKIKEAPYKPLTSPLQGVKDMEKEEDKEEERVKKRQPQTEEVYQALIVHFGIQEITQFNLIRELDSFCMVLQSKQQIPHFIEQFKAYQTYKAKAQEKTHNFKGFIGTIEKGFEDGGWCADNWVHKLNNFKENGKQQTAKDADQRNRNREAELADLMAEKFGTQNN